MPINPALASPGFIFRPDSWVDPLPLAGLYPTAAPLEVELGSGDGSFLVRWAQQNPQNNFLAVERLLGRLRKLDRKATRAGLTNIRLLRIEASYFLQYLLPATSVSALHLYFPDPWPKRKHRRNRLVNAEFPSLVSRVLQDDGLMYLRTDDEDYFQQMKSVFAVDRRFAPVETPPELAEVVTDFERHFNAQGTATRRASYRLTSR